MAGVKLGDRLLAVGITDIPLIATLATKAGLTGRAAAVDADEARARHGGAAIEREGALVEIAYAPWNAFPFDADSFDVALLRDLLPDADATSARAVSRGGPAACSVRAAASSCSTRPGARDLQGWSADATRTKPTAEAGGATAALDASGYAGVRVLAEREGVRFVEAAKRS